MAALTSTYALPGPPVPTTIGHPSGGPGEISASGHPLNARGEIGSLVIALHNPSANATGPYQQPVSVNSSAFSNLINRNWTNGVPYYTANGTPVYGWIESNATNTSTDTLLWLDLYSIPGGGWTNVSIGFWPANSFNLSATGYMGEAPELSATYGAFDNGAKVFNFYDNFSGNSLNAAWGVHGSWTYTVRDGFQLSTVPGLGAGIYTKATYAFPAIVDYYGNLYQPMTATAFVSEGFGTSGCTACGTANSVSINSQGSSLANGPTPQAAYGTGQSFGASMSTTQQYGVFTAETVTATNAFYEHNYSQSQNLTMNIPPSPLPVGLAQSGHPTGALTTTETTLWIRERTYEAQWPTANVSEVTYPVTFEEIGLPTGARWWVNTSAGSTATSTGALLTFNATDGTYAYRVATSDKTYAAPTGSFTVTGAPTSQIVTFVRETYPVTFVEGGLPTGSSWLIVVAGQSFASSTGPTLTLPETNGSFTYTAAASNLTYAAPAGAFSVTGGARTISVLFGLVVFPILFSQTGLPPGTGWGVTIPGGGFNTSSGANLSIPLTNGTFSYTVATTDTTYAAPPGTIHVSGFGSSISVAFVRVTYPITFTETGLPSGSDWSVNISGVSTVYASSTSVTVNMPNGTYTYTASRPDRTYQAVGGSFSVTGGAATVALSYLRFGYAAIFTEAGLPSGASWTVTLDGVPVTGKGNLAFADVVNGTHTYTVGPAPGFVATPHSGVLKVNGGAVAVLIAFGAVAPSFLGLPAVEGYSVTGAGLLVIALVIGFVFLRKRRPPPPPPPRPPAAGARPAPRPPPKGVPEGRKPARVNPGSGPGAGPSKRT
ncbi:MAG TPA: hypothetical protein VGX00_05065 [Thermoplasmata archaeon]|nr:hypothetical protein [Thermoplasmata archaeon]